MPMSVSVSLTLARPIIFLKTPSFWCQYRFRYITYYLIYTVTSHVFFSHKKRENKSQRKGYPSVNQHSPSKCNFKDGKGGICHVCSLEVIEYIWCFICSIYSNWNVYGFFETAHLDYQEGNIEGSILCSKNPGNMPKLNTNPKVNWAE